MEKIINEKTLLPISLVIIIIGASVWLTNIYFLSRANAKVISKIDKKQVSDINHLNQTLLEISTRLARIEGALNIKKRK